MLSTQKVGIPVASRRSRKASTKKLSGIDRAVVNMAATKLTVKQFTQVCLAMTLSTVIVGDVAAGTVTNITAAASGEADV